MPNKERENRFKNNLCLYCRKSGHQVKQCPDKNTKHLSTTYENLYPDSDWDIIDVGDAEEQEWVTIEDETAAGTESPPAYI